MLNYLSRDNPYDMEAFGYVDVFFKSLGAVSYRKDVKFGILDLMGTLDLNVDNSAENNNEYECKFGAYSQQFG